MALFRELAEQYSGRNVVFSPAGAEGIIRSLRTGTAGKTREELSRLNCGAPSEAASTYSSCAIFADETLPLRPGLSSVQRVPLTQDKATAIQHINSWAMNATGGHIPALLTPGVLSPNSRMLVCDALYFSAEWEQAFSTELTETDTFTRTDGSRTEVEMMDSGETEFAAAGGKNWRAVAIPYSKTDTKLYFVAILPRADAHGFAARFTADKLDIIRRKLSKPELTASVFLPRFRAESELMDLSEPLRKLGVQQIFTDKADFSPWTTTDTLQLAAVRQKACVEVTESGTAAAAITYGELEEESCEETNTLYLDRPFLWYIGELTPGSTPLMMGIWEARD